MLTYNSCRGGYHAYKDLWHPIVCDESLIFEQKENDKCDKNAVSMMLNEWVSKEVVVHLPFNWSKLSTERIPVVSKSSYLPCCDWKGSDMRC